MGILSGRCDGYCGCAVMVVGSSTLSTGRGMDRRSAAGSPGVSSWILGFCGSSTLITLMRLAGRQGSPVEGGVLLRFRVRTRVRTLHLHLPCLMFLGAIHCATISLPPRHSGPPLCLPSPDELPGCGTAHLQPFHNQHQSLQEPCIQPHSSPDLLIES